MTLIFNVIKMKGLIFSLLFEVIDTLILNEILILNIHISKINWQKYIFRFIQFKIDCIPSIYISWIITVYCDKND